MILSSLQQSAFWKLWAQACRQQGWTRALGFSAAEIDAGRKQFLQRCGFASLTEVDRTQGFTKVKTELELLIRPDLAAAQEAEDPTLNQARIYRHKIRRELLPCLALYQPDPDGFLRGIMEDKNRWWKIDRPVRGMTLEDLDARPIIRQGAGGLQEFPSALEQLVMTLAARLNVKRKAAGDTLHEMKTRAGVECLCSGCLQGGAGGRGKIIEQCFEPELEHVENPF